MIIPFLVLVLSLAAPATPLDPLKLDPGKPQSGTTPFAIVATVGGGEGLQVVFTQSPSGSSGLVGQEDPMGGMAGNGDDALLVDERNGDDALLVGKRNGNDALLVDERNGDDALLVDERNGNDALLVDERNGNDAFVAGKNGGVGADDVLTLGARALGDASRRVGDTASVRVRARYGAMPTDKAFDHELKYQLRLAENSTGWLLQLLEPDRVAEGNWYALVENIEQKGRFFFSSFFFFPFFFLSLTKKCHLLTK